MNDKKKKQQDTVNNNDQDQYTPEKGSLGGEASQTADDVDLGDLEYYEEDIIGTIEPSDKSEDTSDDNV